MRLFSAGSETCVGMYCIDGYHKVRIAFYTDQPLRVLFVAFEFL